MCVLKSFMTLCLEDYLDQYRTPVKCCFKCGSQRLLIDPLFFWIQPALTLVSLSVCVCLYVCVCMCFCVCVCVHSGVEQPQPPSTRQHLGEILLHQDEVHADQERCPHQVFRLQGRGPSPSLTLDVLGGHLDSKKKK